MPVEDYKWAYSDVWEEVHHNEIDFFIELRNRGFIDDEAFEHEINLVMGIKLEPEEYLTLTEEQKRAKVTDALFEEQKSYFATAFREVLKSLWRWILDQLKSLIDLVVNFLKPVLQQAWDKAQAIFEDKARLLYDGVMKMFEGHSTIMPEDAPVLALKLYGFAMAAGMAAHGAAVATELLHPLKTMGLHQTAAILGDFAGFSRISGATIGTLENRVLGTAMAYAVQDRFRPVQPDDRLLQIMAVKEDINPEQFRQGMAYQGYSEEWIKAVDKTMYHEPRYFELKMMSEDEAASEDWLFSKSRRAGFTKADSKIMVSSYLKTATRTQRLDFYKQAFYMYKEGYITKERFERMLAELELRPEGMHYARRGAELAYLNDYIKDMISLYTDSYLKDIIDDDELLVSLLSLGMSPQRAWLLTAKARVRKRPKPSRAVSTAAKKAASDMQKKYVSLYVTQYRKDLITDELLLESLLAIGLETDLAEVTVSLEAAKKGLLLPAE